MNIGLNRNLYIILEDYVNERIPNLDDHTDSEEIMELIRVWVLMAIHNISAEEAFNNKDKARTAARHIQSVKKIGNSFDDVWYIQSMSLKLTRDRYKFIIKTLGCSLPELDVFETNSQDEQVAQRVWGNFTQHNDLLSKLEANFGDVGSKFVIDRVLDLTMDDDKLRNNVKGLRDEGVQLTGFRGSRLGPVMHGLGIVQSGIILSIHFARHRDGALSIARQLLRSIGYDPDDPTKKNKIDGTIQQDRGYNITSVQKHELKLGLSPHGTMSEKVCDSPFCSTGFSDKGRHQKLVQQNSARSAYFATRKMLGVEQTACFYTNGSRGVGNVCTTLPIQGIWELKLPGKNEASFHQSESLNCTEENSISDRLNTDFYGEM